MEWKIKRGGFLPIFMKIVFYLTIVGIGIVYLGRLLRWLGWVH